ncbi:MAG: FAD-dependent oxidoreductase [Oscillospiraceae bacterium]|jgi:NADPH-dependent 2,4-dienoyl-CoA reductase/sulfur reductase-like enzyme/rhodanese-related sulfurtransferase
MRVLIIGGVAGGATAAARLRRLDETAEIIILERSGFVSYANCGLPYYISGVITDEEDLTLQTPESFWERFQIEVRVHHAAIAIDPAQKTVTVQCLEDGRVYTESYDKLILSPGAKAVRPDFPGIENEKIVTLRTVEDTKQIYAYIKEHHPKQAVVIGGGFIGLEMAENLMESGIETYLLQRRNQVLPFLDYDMACQVHAYLRSKGLHLRFNQAVTGFQQDGERLQVLLKDEEAIAADLVVMAVGVVPETNLAKAAGLKLGIKASIVVNDQMQTSDPDIYAVGDAVEVTQFVTGQPALISLAGPANKQGRIAADAICGRNSTFHGSQASSVIKLFDMTVATTGINEKTAQASETVYDKVITYSASHATYYPGATNMTIKTLFDPESGRILGAQIVGFTGVDKRIDVLATAIRAKMTAADLEELDLAYAPPYSSAKDPVNMTGFVIENIRSGLVKQHHWHMIPEVFRDGNAVLLDVRTVAEFEGGCIPGAVNIPLDDLRDRMEELDRGKHIYVNCYSGLRSYIACRILTQSGFDCSNLSGGYRFYEGVYNDCCYDETPTHPCGIKL